MYCHNLYAVKCLDDLVSLFACLEAAANVVHHLHARLHEDMSRAVARQGAIILGQVPINRLMKVDSIPICKGTSAWNSRIAWEQTACGEDCVETLQTPKP